MNTDLIVDKLVFKDIQLTASNDDQYFVFEDVLYQVMLCFSRDSEISEMVQGEPGTSKMKQYEGPPSGVVPFHGICMFGKIFYFKVHIQFTSLSLVITPRFTPFNFQIPIPTFICLQYLTFKMINFTYLTKKPNNWSLSSKLKNPFTSEQF